MRGRGGSVHRGILVSKIKSKSLLLPSSVFFLSLLFFVILRGSFFVVVWEQHWRSGVPGSARPHGHLDQFPVVHAVLSPAEAVFGQRRGAQLPRRRRREGRRAEQHNPRGR